MSPSSSSSSSRTRPCSPSSSSLGTWAKDSSATSAAMLWGSHRSAASISLVKGEARRPKALRSEEVAIVVLLVERAARVEVDGPLGPVGRGTLRWTAGLGVGRRVDDAERRRLAVQLEDRRRALEEAGGDGDDLSGEVAEGHLVQGAAEAQRRVAADAAPGPDGEGALELILVDAHLLALGEDGGGSAPEDAGVRRILVEARKPGAELLLDVGEGGDLSDVVEGLLTHPPPEALHLPARRGVVGLGVQQRDPEPGARELEHLPAVGGAVVQVDRVGLAVLHQGLREDRQHRLLALAARDAQGDDVARGVVEHGVHPHVHAPVPEGEGRSVADVAVPERARPLSLPLEPRLAALAAVAVDGRAAGEALLAVHPPHRARRHLGPDPAVGTQRAHDERDAHLGVLAADVAEQLAQLGGKVATAPLVRARLWHEGLEAAALEAVQPALQRRDGVAAGRVAAGGAHPLLADAPEQRDALAVGERSQGDRADEAMAE